MVWQLIELDTFFWVGMQKLFPSLSTTGHRQSARKTHAVYQIPVLGDIHVLFDQLLRWADLPVFALVPRLHVTEIDFVSLTQKRHEKNKTYRSTEHLDYEKTQSIKICSAVIERLLAFRISVLHLRRTVLSRPMGLPHFRLCGRASEISNEQTTVARDEDVLRLQIAMGDMEGIEVVETHNLVRTNMVSSGHWAKKEARSER